MNNTIKVLSNLLRPTEQATSSGATRPRVAEGRVRLPRVNNYNTDNRRPRVYYANNNGNGTARVLRPQQQVHNLNYSQGTRVYRIFGEPTRLVEHRGYICDFDKKEGYYKVKYQDGDTEEYNKEEIGTITKRQEIQIIYKHCQQQNMNKS